jgi:hypothetical protein
VPEEGASPAETGGEGRGRDNEERGTKRTKRTGAQGTLDMHVVKRMKK